MQTEAQPKHVRLHPTDGCVEIPVPFLEAELALLEQQARSEERTIGQLIRRAIGGYLTAGCGCEGDRRLTLLPEGFEISEVRLLLPTAILAGLESLAARGETSIPALIRRLVCCSLLEPELSPSLRPL